MTTFDRICAVAAGILAILLMIAGAFGLFFGCHGNFTLPAFWGVIPAFIGWGIYKPIRLAWGIRASSTSVNYF